MKRICIVCEGQTEETFVREVLAPSFYELDLNLIGETIQTSTGHKGGSLSYERVHKHLRNRLNQASAYAVTTLFDFYRLDNEFPGFSEAKAKHNLQQQLEVLNQALHQDVVGKVGCMPNRFIPYIQPHEFEALLFSDVTTLTNSESNWRGSEAALHLARNAVESPEHINERPDTKPAAHLERELKNPSFHKRRHGPILAKRIGLTKIENECKFFANWLNQIRALAD